MVGLDPAYHLLAIARFGDRGRDASQLFNQIARKPTVRLQAQTSRLIPGQQSNVRADTSWIEVSPLPDPWIRQAL